MRRAALALTLCAAPWLTLPACSAAPSDEEGIESATQVQELSTAAAIPVVFDSDMDFDDTTALAYLAQQHKQGHIELRAVTVTNTGAGLPGRGLLHARCMMARFGLETIPVADSPREPVNPFPAWVRGLIDLIISSALADCTLTPEPSEQDAAELIASEIANATRPVTLLATGPVTNFADALAMLDESTRAGGLQAVFTMGGSVHVPGELLEPDPRFDGTQTVNYWSDPPSAAALFDLAPQGKLTMIPHDATNFVPITFAFLDQLAASASTPEADYVNSLMAHPIVQAGLAAGLPAFWWDPLAAVAAVDSGQPVVGYSWERILLIEDGPSAGRTLPVAPTEPGVWMRVALTADQALFEQQFLGTLNGG